MATILRQIVAGPRSRHPETGLDLCYVTNQIITTSGPSITYPQRAYRNPLDRLVKFLDDKHGSDWTIWEFRAEGTGYPDDKVYGRVCHYPWPDHHPPPFRLVPLIMASMRNWLNEVDEGGERKERVAVLHCKAGKGRSGTIACSYLISEYGWKPEEALARFTERRMRPGWGNGVTIPSQLRWAGYVDRWTKSGKHYIERQIEILEVHTWGLRDGVKLQVEGYIDEGKTIKLFHLFTKQERVVGADNTPGGVEQGRAEISRLSTPKKSSWPKYNSLPLFAVRMANRPHLSKQTTDEIKSSSSTSSLKSTDSESGSSAVIYKPSTRIILPSSDVNIDLEQRKKGSIGWKLVTAVAHVWFNCYFEGKGPEQNGKPDDSGIFEIEWDKMDGIRGTSTKGTRALDKLVIVWKAYEPGSGQQKTELTHEPVADAPASLMSAADWEGGNTTQPRVFSRLGFQA